VQNEHNSGSMQEVKIDQYELPLIFYGCSTVTKECPQTQ